MKLRFTLVCTWMFLFVCFGSTYATEMNSIHGNMTDISANKPTIECRYSDWIDPFSWPYPMNGSSDFMVLQMFNSLAKEETSQDCLDGSGLGIYTPAPEPMTLLLIGAGLIGLATFRKKLK